MKRIAKAVGIVFGIGLIALTIFIVPTIWGRPYTLDHFYLRVLIEFVLEHPMLLSYAGALEPYGLDWYSSELSR